MNDNANTRPNCAMPATTPKDVAPFLKQLRRMLDAENAAILRWTPDGLAFEIHDMAAMMEHVLPKYFKHRKYTSFQRQLNYFNFRKWTKSKATVCTFSNEFFTRDAPDLAWRITRKKSVHLTTPSKKPTGTSRCRVITTPTGHSSRSHNKFKTLQGQHWGEDMAVAISVPMPFSPLQLPPSVAMSSPHGLHGHHHHVPSLASPTDMDSMLKYHDHPLVSMMTLDHLDEPLYGIPGSSATVSNPAFGPHLEPTPYHPNAAGNNVDAMDSLDWIDALLPEVERLDDGLYPLACSGLFPPARISTHQGVVPGAL